MNAPARPVRVLVVEDSALVRRDLAQLLATEPRITIIGTANDPYIARDLILRLNPDVLLLDVGLPRLDGLSFLRAITQHRPMPVIILSGLLTPASPLAREAFDAGAFAVFEKPEGVLSLTGVSQELIAKIIEASRFSRNITHPPAEAQSGCQPAPENRLRSPGTTHARQVIVFGASTGGTEALRHILSQLPDGLPGIAIVQHIPPKFSRTFATRLNAECAFTVREAEDGESLLPGLALVAPGGRHLTLHWEDEQYRVRLNDGPRQHFQRPAVDVLFASAAVAAGSHAVGVLLTGMGRDGALGLKQLHQAGAATLAQDKASCIVFGMPRAAWELGAVGQMVSLAEMPAAILKSLQAPPPQAHNHPPEPAVN